MAPFGDLSSTCIAEGANRNKFNLFRMLTTDNCHVIVQVVKSEIRFNQDQSAPRNGINAGICLHQGFQKYEKQTYFESNHYREKLLEGYLPPKFSLI